MINSRSLFQRAFKMTKSRWQSHFEGHPFQTTWSSIVGLAESIDAEDHSPPENVQEIARLKRAINYLDGLLKNIDAELTPKKIWESFNSQAEACRAQMDAYQTGKDIANLHQANEHIDSLLGYIRPYMVLPDEALRALTNSTGEYARALQESIAKSRLSTNADLEAIRADRAESSQIVTGIRKEKQKIDKYASALFDGVEGEKSIQSRIEETRLAAQTLAEEIQNYYQLVISGKEGQESLQSKVGAAFSEVSLKRDDALKLVRGIQEKVDTLEDFHARIFGTMDETSNELKGGLKAELDERTNQLKKLEEEQQQKHSALVSQIETLLPGATSAGLATAYGKLKAGFDQPIRIYTFAFYGSLLLLVIGAFITSIKSFSLWPFIIEFIEVPQWDGLIKSLLQKSPFIAPVVWLTIFSSTRRSQYERLQQEYAHKEALASSYESYKKQIQLLQDGPEALQKELLLKAIEAIAFNASSTLDGKHAEGPPIYELIKGQAAQKA
jgi:hypothetical protein